MEGNQTSVSNEIPLKPRGITPTTVNGTSLSVSRRPTIDRSLPKRAFHITSLMTTTALASGTRSSSAVNVRPIAALAPSIGKYDAETISASTRSAPSVVVRLSDVSS
jgi:hypothetical protein